MIPLGKGDSHMPVGWGSAPIADILAAYADGYNGLYMMELRSRYFEHVSESRDNLQQILDSLTKKPKNSKAGKKEAASCSST